MWSRTMKKHIIFLASIALSSGLAIAQDEPSDAETTAAVTSPGARIGSYGKVGQVTVDGQQIYLSKRVTDIVRCAAKVSTVRVSGMPRASGFKGGSKRDPPLSTPKP